MAELHGTPLNPYLALLRSRLRSQAAYRGSLWLDIVSSVATGLVEVLEVLVIFHNVDVLGGLNLTQSLLVFGIANLAWALSQFVVGDVDNIHELIRSGELTSLFARPLPVLGQMMTNDFSIRRLARVLVGIGVVAWAVPRVGVTWGLAQWYLLVSGVVAGAFILGSLFLLAAGVQFFVVDGGEVTNSFTYGSGYAAQQSAGVFPTWLRSVFLFLLPVMFAAYLPTIAILGLPGPLLAPAWLGWFSPLVAAAFTLTSTAAWTFGLRHYQGAGG